MSLLVQVYPSRISITPKRKALDFHKVNFNKQCKSWYQKKSIQDIKNFNAVKNPFIISKTSKKKIMDSINSMYVLSNKRTVEMASGKKIYNFKLAFITLTLPSVQCHDDVTIKSNILNHFLIEIKKAYGVQNYLWKAEIQKNENIHFHLIVDKYIDYQALRRRWNRCINKLGYVDAYSQKMQKLSLLEYQKLRNKHKKVEFNICAKAYASGVRSGWTNPNSVDVRSVSGKKEIASYLAKYITKSFSSGGEKGSDIERELKFGRSWARSYTLSRLKYQNKYLIENVTPLINYLNSVPKLVKKITGDFFTVYYFNAEKLNLAFRTFHKKSIFGNAEIYRYPLPY